MRTLLHLIIATILATSFAQIVQNGDVRVISYYRRALTLEAAARKRKISLEVAYTIMSDIEYKSYTNRLEASAYVERGSQYGPDGRTPIPGNENLDSKIIDPRTPPGFGNPFLQQIRRTALLSPAILAEAKFWNVTIPVTIGNQTLDLPINNGDFSEALTIWYQNNYDQFTKTVESVNFDEQCEVEMDTEMLHTNYVQPYCGDHCHCYGHDHNCCITCQYGQIGNIYECQWYKVIMDAQVALAQSIMYQRRRERCFGANNGSSGGESSSGDTKRTILANPIELKKTKNHPMTQDVAISKGVF